MSFSNYDVVITGAGPTGLMLANHLAKLGVNFIIADSKVAPTVESRALVVQARSLEIYEQMGLSDAVMDDAEKLDGIALWKNGKKISNVILGKMAEEISAFNNITIYEQSKNETLLYNNLKALRYDVKWNTSFVKYEEKKDGFTVILDKNGMQEIITSKYLVACDGAKSLVREQSALPFEGGTYEHVFYVADTHIDAAISADKISLFAAPKSMTVVFPMKGEKRFRIIGILPPEYYHKPDLNFDEMINHFKQSAGLPLRVYDTAWHSSYRLHHKKISSFNKGNLFFAGDAAHVHSPAGGQGMNTGLQDAYNLAWKLAMVIKQGANESLLLTYHEERNPVAVALLKTTDRGFSFMVNQRPLYVFMRMQLMLRFISLLMKSSFVKKQMFLLISQTAIAYKNSTLSKGKNGNVKAGLRFPFCEIINEKGEKISVYQFIKQNTDGYFLLMKFNTEDDHLQLPSWIKQISLPVNANNSAAFSKCGFEKSFVVLLRPDNYIAYLNNSLDEEDLKEYLKRY